MRLICLPYAGGGAAVYRDLHPLLPELEVCNHELPGRGRRLAEPCTNDMTALVDALLKELDDRFDRPFALLGHSMGAAIAFELALRLPARARPNLRHLFVSARGAPGSPSDRRRLQHLDDRAFIEALHDLGGTPVEVLENDELMALLMPVLRADFTLIENYRPAPGRMLDVDITAFAGRFDESVPVETVANWRDATTGDFELQVIEGDHFFLRGAMPTLASMIGTRLRREGRVALSVS